MFHVHGALHRILFILAGFAIVACGNDDAKETGDTKPITAVTDDSSALLTNTIPVTKMKIQSVSTSGDACEEGSTAFNISPDQQAFTTLFQSFQVAIEATNKRQRVVSNCAVALDLAIPSGFQVAILNIQERGYADLPKGSRARLTTQFQWADKRGKKILRTPIHGPYSDDFQINQTAKLTRLNWSPCGGAATLEIGLKAVVVVPKNAEALLAVDTLDGELTQKLGLTWRKCK